MPGFISRYSNVFVAILFSVVGLVGNSCDFIEPSTGKIVYIGRYSGDQDTQEVLERARQFNQLHTEVLLRYISDYNSRTNSNLELVTLNNEKNPESTLELYRTLAANNDVVGIIDNTWSTEIIGAKDFLKESDLPVIAINASRSNLDDFGESTLFLTNYDKAFEDIVTMSTSGLNQNAINLVSKEDFWVHQKLINSLTERNIEVASRFTYSSENEPLINASVIESLCSNGYPIIFNSSDAVGGKLMGQLLRTCSDKVIVGHAEIMNIIDSLDITNGNELIILAESEDAVNKDLFEDVEFIKTKFPELEKFNIPFFSKRIQDAWLLLEAATESGDGSRQAVSQGLVDIKNDGVVTTHDWVKFDESGALLSEKTFIRLSETGAENFDLQVNSTGQIIPSLTIGVEIVDIQNINLDNDEFRADFFYWVTYDSTFSNLEAGNTFLNMKEAESRTILIKEKYLDNKVYRLYKVSGKFIQNYDKRNFPFDRHEIVMQLQVLNPTEKARVSFDRENFHQQFSNLITSGWESSNFYVTVDNTVTKQIKGDTDFSSEGYHKFKNIFFRLQISRIKNLGMLRVVLPLFFIGFLSLVLLHIENLEFGIVGGVLASVFLTIITFSISLSRVIPVSNVLTKASLLFITAFITVVVCFLVALFHNIRGLNPATLRFLRTGLLVAYLLVFSMITLINY